MQPTFLMYCWVAQKLCETNAISQSRGWRLLFVSQRWLWWIIRGASYCFCISKILVVMKLSFYYQSHVRNFSQRLQQPYLEWKHFFWPIKKTWLMSILSLAMQLQRSHNQSQEDVHVGVDTCCPTKLQLLCPILNVLWIISCTCKVLYVLFL